MAKLTFQEKRNRVRQLEEEIANAEAQLKELLDPPEKAPAVALNFAVNEKVLEIIREHPDRIEKGQIIPYIKAKYGVTLTSNQLTSAISALKYKGQLEIIGRAVYKLKKKEAIQE